MLPFARLVSYGNEIPKPPSVKKIVGDPLGITVLYSDGDMFMRGGGNSYKMGNSSTTSVLNSWVKCQKKVIDVWACTYCTIILADDGKLYHAGAKSVFGTSGTNPVFTDVSSTFTSLNMSAIKDIQFTLSSSTDISALILMQDGTLYGIGTDSNYNFWWGIAKIPQLITTSVQSIAGSPFQNNFHYIKNGIYYRSGLNAYYQLGTGVTGSLAGFVELSLTGTVLDVQSIDNVTKLLVQEGGVYKLYTAGNNNYLSIGNSVNTSVENDVFKYTEILPSLTANSFENISSSSYLCALRNSDGLICTNGGTSLGGGLGREVVSNLNYLCGNYFPVQFDDITINGADVDKFGAIGYGNTSVLSIGGDLYWSGSITYFKEQGVGTEGIQTKFRKCIPFK